MFGGIMGFVFAAGFVAADKASGWWLLWGFLLGVLLEVAVRFGAGGDMADAVGGCGDGVGGCD